MCLMPANPDISGIGVRIAIYLQNLLCFFPAFWAIWDGRVSVHELQSAETQSTTNLVLAFAVLISCIVQAITLGLTSYHATIVLSLSWMNNTNAFIYFLLYVRYKCQGVKPQVEPNWSSWADHVKGHIRGILGLSTASRGAVAGAQEVTGNPEHVVQGGEACRQLDLFGREGARTGAKALFKRIALLLGSLHLTLMAGLGIWLWSDPRSFGIPDASCAVDAAHLAIVGARVPFGSQSLRIVSLVVYSLFLLPGLNLLLPIAAFLGLYIWHNQRISRKEGAAREPAPVTTGSEHSMYARFTKAYHTALDSPVLPIFVGLVVLLVVNIIFITDIELTLHRNIGLQDGEGEETQWGFGQILAMLLVFLPLRDVVEMVLARRLNQQWNQALRERNVGMIVGLVQEDLDPNVPGQDGFTALEIAVLQEEWEGLCLIAMATLRRGDDLPRFRDGRTAFETLIGRNSVQGVQALLRANVNPNATFDDGKTPLETATLQGRWEIVEALAAGKALVNVIFQDGQTALHHAGRIEKWTAVCALLRADANFERLDPNIMKSAVNSSAWGAVELFIRKGANPDVMALSVGETLLEHVVSNSSVGAWGVVYSLGDANHDLDIIFPYEHSFGYRFKTALEAACAQDKQEAVQHLLSRGANPNLRSGSSRDFPLQVACDSGAIGPAKLLLEGNADPNLQGGQYGSALQAACDMGYLKIAQLLLDYNASPNIGGGEYGSPLQAACFRGHLGLVNLLLDANADVNLQGGKYGCALQAACAIGHLEIATLLLDRNADPNLQGGFEGTALQAACSKGNLAIVRLLLEKNADPNVQDGPHGSALYAACARGHASIAALLLDKCADPNLQGGGCGYALQAACGRLGNDEHSFDTIKLLLDRNADPNLQGGYYGTALQAACSRSKSLDAVKLLLDRNADPNLQGSRYGSALQAACVSGTADVAMLLLDHNANPNLTGGDWGSALAVACSRGYLDLVKSLLDHNADPNLDCGTQDPALQAACAGGHVDIVKLLIAKGADINAQGGEHGSALAAARAKGHHEIEKLLLDNGALKS